ncbi:MAG TPA: spermidine/putrescine ABC transporter substrate-binding protein [Pilimelia sp.]|nr:spermidine/putrescine ABC transporter substrate-binding protein [Pilimelia sp.]
MPLATPRSPLSPEATEVLAALPRAVGPRGALSRRRLLGGAALAAGGVLLGGCGTPGTRQAAGECVSEDRSAAERTVAFSNWPLYIDADEKRPGRRPTLDRFTAETGIAVTYTEDINDNDEFFGKLRPQLADCRPTDRDIITMSDWMVARLVRLGWLQKLDRAALPTVEQNLLPSLRQRSWDPTGEYAVPWQAGLAGIAWNAKVTKEVRTVGELLTRPDLKGRVTMLTELRDTMGLLLFDSGYDPADFTEAQFDAALERLAEAVASGQIRRFTGNDYASELAKGDIAACLAWSGDVLQLNLADRRVRFVAPAAGAILFSDNMVVPNGAAHRANAQRLMDYYYRPEVAAELAASVNYICPVQGAQEELRKRDAGLAAHPLIFPDAATLGRAREFMTLTEEQERAYSRKFQKVIGA